jgi:hypothetical protein
VTDHGRRYGDKTSYPICVWNGILDHCQKIGLALWVFLWCLDKITVEKDGIGWVFGKAPVRVSRIAQDFGICEKTVRIHLNRLKAFGYITTKKTPFGLTVAVKNSRKIWAPSAQTSGKNLPEASTGSGSFIPESGKNLPESPVRTYRSKEDKAVDKAVDAAAMAAALVPDSPNPWKLLGSDLPMGSPKFQRIVEHFFATRNGNPLSDAMERAIQSANKRGVKVPPKFFEAKRTVERREVEESAAPATERPELEELPWRKS